MTDPTAAPTMPAPGTTDGADEQAKSERVASLWSDARRDLVRNPIFLISAVIILGLIVLSVAPQLFTERSPYEKGFCQLSNSMEPPKSGHPFGYDVQGCDVYTRTIYGARNSVIVGILTSAMTSMVGGVLGLIAGLRGGWVDTVLSRITEIFFAIPLMLGGLLFLSMFDTGNVYTVALILMVLGWPSVFRIMRGAVLSNKHNDYVIAARALGAGTWRIATRHVLPNAIAPVIVLSTINLGIYISAEAALSYLGIGVQSPNISWGLMIADAQSRFLNHPHMLLYPSLFLSVTVLAFIMLGDAVRDALDPKLR
ncbi:ABC transporter permease [Streptomyces sp. A7024]|uniref:ABC transporter permease n=1 Tax=Streptomyces coryli TaxID=1128680 RepID=A0A6G4TVA3_9ACTN|nr:ABC transporter permease [Streptomyces coryli]NGN63450.1 ABC transporter permease [Streptomyces coryli]